MAKIRDKTPVDDWSLSELNSFASLTIDRFVSRSDIHNLQKSNGKYGKPIREPITRELIVRHLKGEITVGAYTLNTDNDVKYLIFDIDNHDKKKKYINWRRYSSKIIRHLYRKYGLRSILEFSGSKGSVHVIVLLEPTKAHKVKAFGKYVLKELGISHNKVKEVFPKNDELSEEGVGNLVKLPCGFHKKAKRWSRLLFPDINDPLSKFKYRGKQTFNYLYGMNPQKLPEIPEITEEIPKTKEEQQRQGEQNFEQYDDKTLSGILSKQLHCVEVGFNTHTSLTPSEFKFQCGRSILFDKSSNEIVVEYFRNHPDYDRFISIEKVEEVRQQIINEIYDEMSKDKKSNIRFARNKEKIKKQIAVNLSKGYYKSRKISCKEMKKICGDYIRKNICPVSCEMAKVARSSARKLNSTSAIKGIIILSLKPVWKIINVESNRHKIKGVTYVHVSGDELDKIIKDHQEFCINGRHNFIKDMIRMDFIESENGRHTFEAPTHYDGRKYRFKKDVIDEILNRCR